MYSVNPGAPAQPPSAAAAGGHAGMPGAQPVPMHPAAAAAARPATAGRYPGAADGPAGVAAQFGRMAVAGAQPQHEVFNSGNAPRPPVGLPVDPPPPAGNSVAHDPAQSPPTVMRPTVFGVPNNAAVATKFGLPFGVIVQPLANIDANDESKQVRRCRSAHCSPPPACRPLPSNGITGRPMVYCGPFGLGCPLMRRRNRPRCKGRTSDWSDGGARACVQVPVVNFGACGVIRCRRCRSYINPFVQFLDSGRRWRCNVCGMLNEVRLLSAC